MAFKLPPLSAVRLFEAAARSLSFKAAAEELLELMQTHGGHSGGAQIRREDAYEGRV